MTPREPGDYGPAGYARKRPKFAAPGSCLVQEDGMVKLDARVVSMRRVWVCQVQVVDARQTFTASGLGACRSHGGLEGVVYFALGHWKGCVGWVENVSRGWGCPTGFGPT